MVEQTDSLLVLFAILNRFSGVAALSEKVKPPPGNHTSQTGFLKMLNIIEPFGLRHIERINAPCCLLGSLNKLQIHNASASKQGCKTTKTTGADDLSSADYDSHQNTESLRNSSKVDKHDWN